MTDFHVKPDETGKATSIGLLERVRANDSLAWERMVELYTPLVSHWCSRAGLQDADLADVRQEVFLSVMRKIGDFRRDQEGDTFRGWLRRIAQRKVIDHWRKQKREPAPVEFDLDAEAERMLASSDDGAADEGKILYRRALEMVEREFEPSSWRAFWRVVIDGQKPADVASELAISVNAVYLAKSRVLARLRAEFTTAIEQ